MTLIVREIANAVGPALGVNPVDICDAFYTPRRNYICLENIMRLAASPDATADDVLSGSVDEVLGTGLELIPSLIGLFDMAKWVGFTRDDDLIRAGLFATRPAWFVAMIIDYVVSANVIDRP